MRQDNHHFTISLKDDNAGSTGGMSIKFDLDAENNDFNQDYYCKDISSNK